MNTSDIKRLDQLVDKLLFDDFTQHESDELDRLYDTFVAELDEPIAGLNSTAQ